MRTLFIILLLAYMFLIGCEVSGLNDTYQRLSWSDSKATVLKEIRFRKFALYGTCAFMVLGVIGLVLALFS